MEYIKYTERFRLGIIFNFDPKWLGGIVYIINLIRTLNFLKSNQKPEIFLFYNHNLSRFLNEFDYPFLNLIEWDFPKLINGNIKSWLLRRNLFIEEILEKYPIDAVFPLQDYPVRINTGAKLISWSTDFQHKYYPEYFSKKQILGRDLRVKNALKKADSLVLSSHDAHNDLKKYYKVREGLSIHIYHFVSIIDDLQDVKIDDLLKKYKLPGKYYMISNQFHKHKNHRIAFTAVAKLAKIGIKINLAITGKFPDASDSPYMSELHTILKENRLYDQIIILGVISRKDQLQLMRYSQAVIQPSLFEGWSTVIEDARSLQVPVIAANLKVNIEQLQETGNYFDPYNSDELVEILKDFPERDMEVKLYEEYEERVKKASETLMKIFCG